MLLLLNFGNHVFREVCLLLNIHQRQCIMTKNQRLFNELRYFGDKEKILEYDKEFFAKKSLSYKSLVNIP